MMNTRKGARVSPWPKHGKAAREWRLGVRRGWVARASARRRGRLRVLSATTVSRPHGCAIGVWVWAGRAMAPETVLDRAHAYSGGTGGSADGPSSGTLGHSAGRSWDRQRTHVGPVCGPSVLSPYSCEHHKYQNR